MRVRVCGGLEIEAEGRVLPDALLGGRQGRLVLAYLVCERPRAVRREELAELLWADRLPDSWTASLSAVISRLRRLLTEAGLDGTEAIVSTAGTYQLLLPADTEVDLDQLEVAVDTAEAAAAAGDVEQAVAAAGTAESIAAGGFLREDCDWVDRQREAVRDLRVRAALARAAAHLAAGASARAVDAARDALALDETREASYRHLMRALAAAGERAEALRVWERCRTTLVEELGVDPSPETEAVYLEVLHAGAPAPTGAAAPVTTALPSGVVTFLLTDIVDSSSLWDKAPDAMALALERHDAIVAEVVAVQGGTLLKSKLEGDATVSVFARASDGAAAALALQRALTDEPWPEGAEPRVRMAMHTGEAFERGGDYFGPALNRAARLRGLAGAGQVLLSQAVTELVRDHLPGDAVLRGLGHRDLRGLSRGENVYALVHAADAAVDVPGSAVDEVGELVRPDLPAALSSSAPFVGRGDEQSTLVGLWEAAAGGAPGAGFIGGEPGVGKSRLAGEIAAHAHAAGAIVLYGRCDEDLGAPLQPFIEALRTLVPALGATRVGSVRGVDELTRVVPELADLLPDRAPAVRADPDTERLALFDAVTNLLASASAEAPVLLVLDDLHWAGKTTLSLLRHVLRGAKGARLLVVGTYRDTELARTHPLAETLADLRRDAAATRISLGGLAGEDIDAYLVAVGIDDRALGRELAEVTSGNPFFLIEVLRHVAETGGTWSPGNLPEGVREATGRRLSRLSDATNQALSVAAVVGATFELALVEQAQGSDLVDEIAEATRAGLVAEEPGSVGRFRFAHALVRQVLLSELVTVKRVRLHKTIAELLEAAPVGDDPDARLADLAYHWSECASLGGGGKAVDACRRAADRAMERLAYEEAGDLYGMALQVLDADGDASSVDGDGLAELHLARCDALLTAGDVAGARAAIDALEGAAGGSERLAAWYTTYEGLLAVLAEPDRLTEIVQSIGAAAGAMRAIGDLRGEARAHYVHASALERLGQIGAAERALDAALAAARTADDRRLADSILAEAPPAALWGPSSVTRASGRCLDVVRVLRINDGAPAVESVALRCQAVLEALRGRSDAARKMIASARRTVERLGLAHRQLETEVMAGFIELLAGDAPAAEALLRRAYEGLRERGLGGEAAQAAAFLGSSLLLQGRVDEADEIAAEAEVLAGSDLKAAIAWRSVRAECAARRGDADRALALAHEAVELAAATDALLLVVDARLALATVLHVTGDHAAADAEARRAVEACEAKGATALAERARGGTRAPAEPMATAVAPRAAAPETAAIPCPAWDAALVWTDRFNRGAIDEILQDESPDLRSEELRPLLRPWAPRDLTSDERDLETAHAAGFRFDPPKLLVARGRHALIRWDGRTPDAEWSFLIVFGVDGSGRITDFVLFEPADRNAANRELDRLTQDELEVDNLAWQTVRRHAAATNDKDMDAVLATMVPGYRIDRRTPAATEPLGDPTESLRVLFGLDDWSREDSAIELHGEHRVLVHDVVWFRDGVVEDAEMVHVQVFEVDDAGRIVAQTAFPPEELEAARAVLHRPDTPSDTLAARTVRRWADATNAHDWDALVALVDPDVVFLDRRRVPTVPDETELLQVYGSLFELDDWSVRRTVLETAGDSRVMVRDVVWFRQGDMVDGEVETIGVFDVDADGRIVRLVSFAGDDLDGARAELHRSAVDVPTRFENEAFRAALRMRVAYESDREALAAIVAPGFEHHDRRTGIGLDVTGEAAIDALLQRSDMRAMQEWSNDRSLRATRGDRLALFDDRVTFVTGDVGPAEVRTVSLIEVDEAGLIVCHIAFDDADPDGAFDELDRRYVAQGGHDLAPFRRAMRDEDWAGFRDRYADDAVTGWELSIDHTVATHPRVGVVIGTVRGEHDGNPHEIGIAALIVFDEQGGVTRTELYDLDQLDEALRRFDEVVAGHEVPSFENAAWRAGLRMRDACAAQDWDRFLATLANGFEYHDARSAVQLHLTGEDAPEAYRSLFHLDEWHWERTLIGTRGDHLALIHDRCSFADKDAGAAEITTLTVVTSAPSGRILRSAAFPDDDLAAAFAELDRQYVEQGGPDVHPYHRAFAARDWDRFRAFFAPDAAIVDHRFSGFGRLDRDGFTEFNANIWPEGRLEYDVRIDHVVASGSGVTLVVGGSLGLLDGGEFEIKIATVSQVDAAGRIRHLDLYSLEQLGDARAEYDRLVEAAGDAVTPNAAWHAQQRLEAAFNAQDLDRVRAELSPDFTYHDRRSTMLVDHGGEEALSVFRVGVELDHFHLSDRLLEVRGDRLVLVEQRAEFQDGASGPAEITTLTVIESDAAGLVARHVVFEATAIDDALVELEARATALNDAAAPNAAWRTVERWGDAWDRHDWDALAGCFHDDVRHHDRRVAVSTAMGRDELLAMYRVGYDLDEWDMRRTLVATRGEHLVLAETLATFRDGAAGPAEVATLAIFEVDEAGLVTQMFAFEEDALDEATAQLDACAAAHAAAVVPNRAWEVSQRFVALYNAHDEAGLRAIHSPAYTYHDRRDMVTAQDLTGEGAQQWFSVAMALDEFRLERRLLATDGDDRVLVAEHAVFRDGATGPAEIDTLAVFEIDPDGLALRNTCFAPDAMAEALAELHAGREATTTDEGNLAWQASLRQVAASAAVDWDAYVATMDPSFEYVDERHSLWVPTDDPLEIYRTMFSLTEWSLDRSLVATRGEHLALIHITCSFRDRDAGLAAVSSVALFESAPDGRLLRETAFDADDLDGATAALEARWAELQEDASEVEANAAWQVQQEEQRLLEDPLAIPHNLAVRSVAQPGWTLVAALGEHVCLHDTESGTIVHEVDDAGQVVAALTFAGDTAGRRAAFEELVDRGYRRLGLADPLREMTRAIIAGDNGKVGAAMADGCSVEDHRRLRPVEPQGADGYVQLLLGQADELAPDHVMEILRLETAGDESRSHLAVIRIRGTTTDDAAFESVYLSVSCWNATGLMTHLAMYEPEDIGEARARMRAGQPGTGDDDPLAIPRSLAVRSVAKPGWTLLAALGENACLHDTGERLVVHEVDDGGDVVAFLAFDRSDRRHALNEIVRRANARVPGMPESAGRMISATNAHDLTTLRACMADDCVWEDHRRLRITTMASPDEYIELNRGAYELAPDYWIEVVRWHRAEAWGMVVVSRAAGTTADGVSFDDWFLTSAHWDDDGLMKLIAVYDPEDLDLALDRFAATDPAHRDDELDEAERLARDPLAIPRNLAVRSVAEPGWALLSALGDHFCLHDTGPRLVLHEVDDTGELITSLAFDRTDRSAAFDEVSVRAFTRYGAPMPASGMLPAMNARDVAAFRACLSDGCVIEDHRSLPTIPIETGEQYTESFELYMELASDYCVEMIRIDAVEAWGCVTVTLFTGTSNEGAAFEISALACSTWDDTGHTTLIALYDPQDREAALARLAVADPDHPAGD